MILLCGKKGSDCDKLRHFGAQIKISLTAQIRLSFIVFHNWIQLIAIWFVCFSDRKKKFVVAYFRHQRWTMLPISFW